MDMEPPKQINNINERVVDDLKTRLSAGSRICVAAASFSIYAFEALKQALQFPERRSPCHHQQIREIQRLHPCRQRRSWQDIHGSCRYKVLREPQQKCARALSKEAQR